MNIPGLEKMWSAFADIPINLDDEIESDFYGWKKPARLPVRQTGPAGGGTYRFDIWYWFNENLPIGIVKDFNMMYK